LAATVNSSANDAEQSAAGAVTLDSTDLELVNDWGTGGNQTVGLRFENLTLPPGAVVASAGLQFSADEAQSENTALTVRAQAADSAPSFTTDANNLTRPLTDAAVPWGPAAWATIGERGPLQRTPDLSPLVRVVIARPGWMSGNAMAFIITGTGHRTAEAADKAGGLPPTLTIDYWPELPIGSYERWAAARVDISSPAADLDGDGYDNFFEYANGLDPSVPNHGATPLIVDGAWLHLAYIRPATVTDVNYRVEWADAIDAGTWSRAGVTEQILSDDGSQRIIRATLPKGTGHRFVRLQVTR
jgi:hypothetical protein